MMPAHGDAISTVALISRHAKVRKCAIPYYHTIRRLISHIDGLLIFDDCPFISLTASLPTMKPGACIAPTSRTDFDMS